jgi:Ca-activated chloride channel family protein
MNISWADPGRLAWLWIVPVLAALLGLRAWWNRRRRERLADKDLLSRVVVGDSLALDIGRIAAAVAATVALVLAIARPQWGEHLVPAPVRGADVVLVVDASLSMLARDVPPDRLGLARRDLRRLIDSLGPSRIGLVAFAGSALRQIPLTQDRGALATLLDALSPDMLPEAGTDLGQALGCAQGMVARSNAHRKLVLLVSDGGDHGKESEAAAKGIAQAGAELWVVGVGADQAVPIPVPEGGLKHDREGNIVTVRLEREGLQSLARAAGGRYMELSPVSWNLAPALAAINSVVAEGGKPGMRLERIDRFPLFLGAAFLLLLLEMLLPRGRSRK